jgi:hypothetical protein
MECILWVIPAVCMNEGKEADTRWKEHMMSDQNENQKKERKRDSGWSCCETMDWKACCSSDADRSEGSGWSGEGMPRFMGKCFSACRYFPLVPVIMGAGFLALGYFLSPEAVRVLWMVGAGIIVVMGLLGLLIAGRIAAGAGSVRR